MHLNHGTNCELSDHIHDVYNIPLGYRVSNTTSQSQSIVNDMIYYQGI